MINHRLVFWSGLIINADIDIHLGGLGDGFVLIRKQIIVNSNYNLKSIQFIDLY